MYTPQQNGVVERKHKHLLQLAPALLFQSQLSFFFLDYASLMATHMVNRLPSSLLSSKTPYEVLYGHPPDCTYLRCFGCLCFATNIKPHKDKFSQRASKCVFLGFQPGMKAYKVYDLRSHTVFHLRDVVFAETVFSFLPLSLCCLLPPLLLSIFLFLMTCPRALFQFLL